MLKVNEILVKNIITKSNLPDADYVINPYVGCSHSCIYCYARFMKRFSRHDEEWGRFVDVKINAPDLIRIKPKDFQDKHIFISSVTDPYLPQEKKYQITRKILEKLVEAQPRVDIQTKSDLILRDIDVLKKLKHCRVGITITTLDDTTRKEVEPFTASVQNRIKALKVLKENGIKTYVFIGPIFPYLTDWKNIIKEAKDYVDFYMLENLNVKGSVWKDIKHWLKSKHNDLLSKYIEIYEKKSDYWDRVEKEVIEFCDSENVDYKVYFHHGKEK